MPRKLKVLTLRTYFKDSCDEADFDLRTLRGVDYDEIFHQYLEFVGMVVEGKFHNIRRLDLIGSGRVLFSFSSVRDVVNQRNLTINLNTY